jgi:coiled-coil domain-containing protein 130
MQGFNMGRYVPPDKEGLTTGNALHRKRTVPATVRFEMPFAVWCNHCPKPTIIGQGVRFNATKTRAGSYHSSAIWAFRIKHNVCGGELEIRTDPKHTAYVVTEGGKKRDTGEEDEETEGGVKILTDGERDELRKSAFKRLERTIEDREAAKKGNDRIEGLMDKAQQDWSDPYARNQRLRKTFREGRKEREKEAEGVEALRQKLGLGESEEDGGLKILPATREDELRAGLVEFQPLPEDDIGAKALTRPLFTATDSKKQRPSKEVSKPTKRITKAAAAAAKRKEDLVSTIAVNTRAVNDPFLNSSTPKTGSTAGKLIPGVKRKRSNDAATNAGPTEEENEEDLEPSTKAMASLVDYDSE